MRNILTNVVNGLFLDIKERPLYLSGLLKYEVNINKKALH